MRFAKRFDIRKWTGQDRLLRGEGKKSEEPNGAELFTPTAEQLRRIDQNVAHGYES
jgi:hypothetical protein